VSVLLGQPHDASAAGYAAYAHPLADDAPPATPSKASVAAAAATNAALPSTPSSSSSSSSAAVDPCKICDDWLLPSSSIIPPTYTMSLPSDRLALSDAAKDNGAWAWVIKPPSSNQGKGISITADPAAIELIVGRKPARPVEDAAAAADADAAAAAADPESSAAAAELQSPARPRSLAPISKSYEIVQRYIANPMLLPQQRKFDLRVFLLWARTEPAVVYWHPGYARACIDAWAPVAPGCGDVNKFAHLTNLAVAKVTACERWRL
jgi:hypothetical protein